MDYKKIAQELIKQAQDAVPKARRPMPVEDARPKNKPGQRPQFKPQSQGQVGGAQSIKEMQAQMSVVAEMIANQIGIDSKSGFMQNFDQAAWSKNSFSNL